MMKPKTRSPLIKKSPLLVLLFVLCVGGQLLAQEIISDGPRAYLNLGGQWDVLPIDGLTFSYPPPTAGWTKEKVPGPCEAFKAESSPYGPPVEALLNKEKTALLHPNGNAVWFKRSFDLRANPAKGQRAILSFEGMAWKSEVWVNGRKLGGSVLGQVPSSYDITDVVHQGANEIVVGLTGRAGLLDVANLSFIAPTSGIGPGIWGKVELQFLPDLNIEKVRVNTSVKEKQINIDVRVTNAGKEARKFNLDALIADFHQNPETRISGPEATLAPGESKVFNLKKDWIAPHLWAPADPALYFARISLASGPEKIDEKMVRFGFREFEIRGKDFYLNGVRTVLLRNSHLNSLEQSRNQFFKDVREEAGRPYNCVRLHIGLDNQDLLDLCDELGLMAIPESAWHNGLPEKFSLTKPEVWLPQVEDYLRKLIELNYNHPSIIMWNLTNESIWGETTAEHMRIADGLIAAAKEADPIRPFEGDGEVNWGGKLPVINLHYPESSIENSLRAKYPNSAFVFPNDFYWLQKDEINGSWRAQFKWDRPLVIGENWYPSGEADNKTAFMGESVYDWEKWRMERMDGSQEDNQTDNEFLKSQQGIVDAYRLQGVAGVNPWVSNGQKSMPPVAVRPVDFFRNFFGGTTGSRKFVVFNDSGRYFADMDLQCRLEADGQTLWEDRFPASVGTGENKIFELKIQCPAVTRQVKAKLILRLREQKAGGMYQLYRFEEDVFILPMANLADLKAADLRLLDSSGNTAKAFEKIGLKLEALGTITSDDLKAVKVVIIGEDTDVSSCKDALVDFANQGGSVVVLRQEQWVPFTTDLPSIDREHVSTRSWIRTFDHPIVAGFDEEQFSYWRPDHLVSLRSFHKPSGGNFHVLLDSGGLYGMKWTPLIEVPVGKGTFVLTSLDLIGRIEIEPAAGTLLGQIIRYAQSFKPVGVAPLRLLAGEQKPLRAVLKTAGVLTSEGLKEGHGPILLDASFTPTPEQLAVIRKFLEEGGNVWLHGFSSKDLAKVSPLFPFKPELKGRDANIQTAVRRSRDPWINNISSQEFSWSKIDLEARNDYFGNAHPTAPLGGEVLQLPTLQSGVRLIEPALLVKVPVGQGAILFDTLAWDQALGAETDKVTRLISSLSVNLGADVRYAVDKTQYEYFPVNLQPSANMGYYDRVANDGKGGWMDDGNSDMRFFLINHVGKGGGVESGMEIEAEVFPEKVTFAGRPFTLTDPRKTDNHSIISLRGGEHGAKLPTEARDIKIGKKADKFWFLQATGWTSSQPHEEVARYVFHYEDGSTTTFPIRNGIEVGDYWVPEPISGAVVAWTGRNLVHSPVGIFCAEWTNPFPDKTVTSVDVIGNLVSTQFAVVAMTGGVIKDKGPRAEVVSDWHLDEFADGSVPNRQQGGPPLKAENTASSPVVDPKSGALKFEKGQFLTGDKISQLPGFATPFSLQMSISPSARPSGYCGGLFEAASYGKNGFRLTLGGDMRLAVEIFSPDGNKVLNSKTVLEIGRTYAVELRFDGSYVTFLVDGQTDGIKESPLPLASEGGFRIGVAAGKDYFYNGSISTLRISKLPAP